MRELVIWLFVYVDMRSAIALPVVPVLRDTTGHSAQSVRAIAICVLHLVAMATAANGVWAQPSFPTQVEGEFDKIEVHGVTLLVDSGATSRAVLTDGGGRAELGCR